MNNTVTDIRKHAEEIEAVASRGEELRKQLHQAIADLPDNPDIKRVERNPRCFVASSKAVFGDTKNNPTLRMDPFYQDFKAQYEVIAAAVDSCGQANVLRTMTAVAETGRLKKTGNNYHRFNPRVVNHLRELIGLPADFSLSPKPDAEG